MPNPAPGFAKQPDRRMDYEPSDARVRVTFGGVVVADSRRTVVLYEADYPAVHYIPQEDVRMDLATRTDHSSHCPFKGDASYWTLTVDGKSAENAFWAYETPFDEAAPINGLIAFYGSKVDGIEIS